MSTLHNGAWRAKHERLLRVEQLSREALETAEAGLPEPRPVALTPRSNSPLDVMTAGITNSRVLREWRGPLVALLAQAAYAARGARVEHER